MRFEWDPEKARSNLRKHGVSFEEAAEVFSPGSGALEFHDPDTLHEDRFIRIGWSSRRLLFVVFTEHEDRSRIISARRADRSEQGEYERWQGPGRT